MKWIFTRQIYQSEMAARIESETELSKLMAKLAGMPYNEPQESKHEIGYA